MTSPSDEQMDEPYTLDPNALLNWPDRDADPVVVTTALAIVIHQARGLSDAVRHELTDAYLRLAVHSDTAGVLGLNMESSSDQDHTARLRPPATELLRTSGALLTRSDLGELGLGRRAADAVFRQLPVVKLPGYSRAMVRAEDYLALIERSTYDDDRVRPSP